MTRFVAGQTGLIAPVPAAEPVVAAQRAAHDTAAQYGVPAHVTVLFPFVPMRDVDVDEVAAVCSAHPAFEVSFTRVGRFPGVAWLDPFPGAPFRALTADVVARWPEYQPYEGAFDGVVPHLTIAEGDDEILDAAERVVLPGLPIRTRVEEIRLIGFNGERWKTVATFALT